MALTSRSRIAREIAARSVVERMRVRRPEYLARGEEVVRQERYYFRSGSEGARERRWRRRRRWRWAAGWSLHATKTDLVSTWLLRGCHTRKEGDGASEREGGVEVDIAKRKVGGRRDGRRWASDRLRQRQTGRQTDTRRSEGLLETTFHTRRTPLLCVDPSQQVRKQHPGAWGLPTASAPGDSQNDCLLKV
jgi:hypothetical protein